MESNTTPSGIETTPSGIKNHSEWNRKPLREESNTTPRGIQAAASGIKNRPEWYQEPLGVVSRTARSGKRTSGDVTKTSLPRGSKSRSGRLTVLFGKRRSLLGGAKPRVISTLEQSPPLLAEHAKT